MVTIMKSIKEFTEEFESKIRNEQKDANLYKTEYVTIDKDGIIKISTLYLIIWKQQIFVY